ncbi:MAG TPA: carboxypeptidase regulatory-like domain-containing protein [Thermoanaerobaculia bacterium]|jgi:hypothetical protein
MRKIRVVLLLAAVTLAFAGCVDEDDILDLGVALSGTVRNASNQDVLRDANVLFQGRTRTTNELGIYVFTDITPGRHTIRVEKAGYRTITREVEIRDEFNNRENFDLVPNP